MKNVVIRLVGVLFLVSLTFTTATVASATPLSPAVKVALGKWYHAYFRRDVTVIKNDVANVNDDLQAGDGTDCLTDALELGTDADNMKEHHPAPYKPAQVQWLSYLHYMGDAAGNLLEYCYGSSGPSWLANALKDQRHAGNALHAVEAILEQAGV